LICPTYILEQTPNGLALDTAEELDLHTQTVELLVPFDIIGDLSISPSCTQDDLARIEPDVTEHVRDSPATIVIALI
jgi:hypothetical protein